MTRARFFDISLNEVTVFSDVRCAGFDTTQYFYPFIVTSAQFQHAHFKGITEASKNYLEITEALYSGLFNCQWNIMFCDGDMAANKLTVT